MSSPAGDGLFRAVVTHPVAVSMVFIAALVFGFVSYQRLAVELMPDISYPTITVRTGYEGAAPQEVEADSPLNVPANLNCLGLELKTSGPVALVGRGAGGAETATAVLRDLIDIWHSIGSAQ